MTQSYQLTDDVQEIFRDHDLNIKRVLREFATCFGTDATIHDVAVALEDFTLPRKEFNGSSYTAGYRGSSIITQGVHRATLADIKQSGSSAKLMFIIGNAYLFQTLETFKVEDIVRYTKSLNSEFEITVSHDKIIATGDTHATIISSKIP